MASQLYGVGGYDPLALVGATLVLGLCATAAGLIPARRAASIRTDAGAPHGIACHSLLFSGLWVAQRLSAAIKALKK
jgi:hypothetical protein